MSFAISITQIQNEHNITSTPNNILKELCLHNQPIYHNTSDEYIFLILL